MSIFRMFMVVVIGALVMVAALTWSAIDSAAKVNKQIQPLPFGQGLAASYGPANEQSPNAALPFGPQLAADYGNANAAPAAIAALPFGPGIAATYGASSERSANATLPFGPQHAADYGNAGPSAFERAAEERYMTAHAALSALPFGPELAATYGIPTR